MGLDFVIVVGIRVHDFQLESITKAGIEFGFDFDFLGTTREDDPRFGKDRDFECLISFFFFLIGLKNIDLGLGESDLKSEGFLGVWVVDGKFALKGDSGKKNIFGLDVEVGHLKVKNNKITLFRRKVLIYYNTY